MDVSPSSTARLSAMWHVGTMRGNDAAHSIAHCTRAARSQPRPSGSLPVHAAGRGCTRARRRRRPASGAPESGRRRAASGAGPHLERGQDAAQGVAQHAVRLQLLHQQLLRLLQRRQHLRIRLRPARRGCPASGVRPRPDPTPAEGRGDRPPGRGDTRGAARTAGSAVRAAASAQARSAPGRVLHSHTHTCTPARAAAGRRAGGAPAEGRVVGQQLRGDRAAARARGVDRGQLPPRAAVRLHHRQALLRRHGVAQHGLRGKAQTLTLLPHTRAAARRPGASQCGRARPSSQTRAAGCQSHAPHPSRPGQHAGAALPAHSGPLASARHRAAERRVEWAAADVGGTALPC